MRERVWINGIQIAGQPVTDGTKSERWFHRPQFSLRWMLALVAVLAVHLGVLISLDDLEWHPFLITIPYWVVLFCLMILLQEPRRVALSWIAVHTMIVSVFIAISLFGREPEENWEWLMWTVFVDGPMCLIYMTLMGGMKTPLLTISLIPVVLLVTSLPYWFAGRWLTEMLVVRESN